MKTVQIETAQGIWTIEHEEFKAKHVIAINSALARNNELRETPVFKPTAEQVGIFRAAETFKATCKKIVNPEGKELPIDDETILNFDPTVLWLMYFKIDTSTSNEVHLVEPGEIKDKFVDTSTQEYAMSQADPKNVPGTRSTSKTKA